MSEPVAPVEPAVPFVPSRRDPAATRARVDEFVATYGD